VKQLFVISTVLILIGQSLAIIALQNRVKEDRELISDIARNEALMSAVLKLEAAKP